MPATAAPYGLRAVRRTDGLPVGNQTKYPIASGSVALWRNQPVIVNQTTGVLNAITSSVMGTSPRDMYIGALNGVEYTAAGNKFFANNFPASTVSADAVGFVADDPNVLYEIQVQAANFDAIANVGKRYELTNGTAGNATTGVSTASLNTAAGAGDTKPFVLVGLVQRPDNINASGFVDVLVRINTGIHMFER